ncbi:Aste57867_2008 [Aphanomyces stellatus]|uniref:Aste57867_2008 protein n=1 Tax=Aphanomyces stellatus TaxID=120398 RepID=A0A485K958_9STRA|nr:hypothetical protein As57867_002006 [Aphanomyces stellatus]VFT79212.1 Aste57867_2008 [Aphanomyces stellatus]
MQGLLSPTYQGLSTPKTAAQGVIHDFGDGGGGGYATNDMEPPKASSWPARRIVYVFGQCVVGLCMVLSILTAMSFSFPWYTTDFAPRVSAWWGVNAKVKGSGHNEMVPVTYVWFGLVLPTLAGSLVVLVLRPSAFSLPVGATAWLHRKPTILRCVISYGELLFLLIVVAGNVLVFHHQYIKRHKTTSSTNTTISNVGTALGFTGLFNLVFLALPATRHCFWMEWLNIPYARGVKYHNWLAVVTTLALALHSAFFLTFYIRTQSSIMALLPCYNCDVGTKGMTNWEYFFGILAMLCFLIIGATSIPYVRRHHFGAFKAAHFLFIPASLFVTLHWVNILYFIYAAIVLYLVNRMYSMATVTAPVAVTEANALPANVVKLTVQCATTYTAGDTVWLHAPALSKTQWHPFSIASSPVTSPHSITLYVRSIGPWTSRLYAYTQACEAGETTPVLYMDGGYTQASPIPMSHAAVVFVAGGIGITPFMGQITTILATQVQQTVWLVWHVRSLAMLQQFQPWLLSLESVASGRLHLELRVTQDAIGTFECAPGVDPLGEERKRETFDLAKPAADARPYAHLSTTKRMLLLVLAFGCSGGLLALVKYGHKIQTPRANLWPIQRIVEWCVVVGGSYLAYLITYIGKTAPMSSTTNDAGSTAELMPFAASFESHFHIQQGRIVWSELATQLRESVLTTQTIGVFVSGPKSLGQAVDATFQGRTQFCIRHETFEL